MGIVFKGFKFVILIWVVEVIVWVNLGEIFFLIKIVLILYVFINFWILVNFLVLGFCLVEIFVIFNWVNLYCLVKYENVVCEVIKYLDFVVLNFGLYFFVIVIVLLLNWLVFFW